MGRNPVQRFARFPPLLRFHSKSFNKDDQEMSLVTKQTSATWTLSDHKDDEDFSLCSSEFNVCSDTEDNTEDITEAPSKHVSFGMANVRTFPQVLGDHPYCSEGCPLELGWDYTDEESVPLDCYESQRVSKLAMAQLVLSPEERRAILDRYSDGEVRKACRRRNRANRGCCRQMKRTQREFFQCSTRRNTEQSS